MISLLILQDGIVCITEADEMKLVLTQNHCCLHVVGFSRDAKAACKCTLN